MKIEHIATARDGGTQLIEVDGIRYHIDHRIGTKTKGRIYDDHPAKGKLIDSDLERQIHLKLGSTFPIYPPNE